MRRYIYVHAHAEDDLDALHATDPKACARIDAILEELEGNQDLLDRLSQNNYGSPSRTSFHVRAIENQILVQNNMWRIRIWDLDDHDPTFRVIYAYFPTSTVAGSYYVLGIMQREIDYDRDHELFRRIESDYEQLRESVR